MNPLLHTLFSNPARRSRRIALLGICSALAFQSWAATSTSTNRFVEITDVWNYNVDYQDLGTEWRETGYTDSSWSSGGGLLYVENSGLPAPKTTLLPATKPMPLTGYFRTWFTNDTADADVLSLVVNTVIDDGVILYLNGTEVLRDGLAAGTVSYSTLAENVGNAVYQGPFTIDSSALVEGANLLAAEVHQSGTTSSDLVLGMTLDMIWTERVLDIYAPVVESADPAVGSTIAAFSQIEVNFDEDVQGVDAADVLINGVAASSMSVRSTSEYTFQFTQPADGVVSVTWAAGHGITDLSTNNNAFAGAGFSYLLAPPSTEVQLEISRVFQTSDADGNSTADLAVDDNSFSSSRTDNLPGSYWQAEFDRPFELTGIELVNQSAPNDAEMGGLTLSLFNMDDQLVYETVLTNLGSSSIAVINLPAGVTARSLRIGLSGADMNDAGNYRVGLAEVRLIGEGQIPTMPVPYVEIGSGTDVQYSGFSVSQLTDHSSSYPASNAVDDDPETFSHTDSGTPNNYWIADLGSEGPIAQVELVARSHSTSPARMENVIIRIMDENGETEALTEVSINGAGETFTFTPPANTVGRYVKVGLENGEENGNNNYIIQLAEVRIYSEAYITTPPQTTSNLATGQRSYMLRVLDSQSLPAAANDGDLSTSASIKEADCYWEVDLGATYALYGVRAMPASGIGDRLTNTVCRLFDENHDSVFETMVTGEDPVFDTDLNGPRFARYVRIGLEDKRYSSGLDGSREWNIGFAEVEVFGRPVSEVGIESFTVSDSTVSSGQDVTLDWSLEDVMRAEIFPTLGSVGAQTDSNGVGSIVQTMTESTEFILVATNHAGIFTEAVGVEVDGATLPVVISEIVADSKYSLEDGFGDASDWIELRNTGNSTVDLTGWGLSDNPSNPMKFTFPSTTIAPHGTLIVFASNEDVLIDPAGNLHADFALGRKGETVQLTASDGTTVLDSVTYPELDTDLAYGRGLDGSWTLMEPTPNAVNTGETYGGWLNTLDWSHARGFYETNFTLTVTSDDPEATILYSLDGTEPAIPYTAGLPITGTTVVRVQAVWPGYKSARIQTKTFLYLDDVIADSNMKTGITQDGTYGPRVKPGLLALPTLSLVVATDGEAVDAIEYDEVACSLEILWPDGQSPIQEDCGVARFGGSYTYFAKKGLSLSFRQKYGNRKLSAPLFNGFDRGVLAKTSFDKLHLRGGNHDMNDRGFFMSDRFIQDSYLDMGGLNPHGRYVHVYLNGEYWGNYNCKEVLNESFLADYLGGDSADYVGVKGNANQGGDFPLGVGDPPNPEPWERVLEHRDSFNTVSPYLDVSHYIDFMLLWGYGNTESEFRACGPKDAGSGHKFWINDPDGFLRDTSSDRISSIRGPGTIWSALLGENDPDFKMLLADRIYTHFFNNGALTPAACDARLVARMDEIRDSYLAESARWDYLTPAEWESKATTIRSGMFPYRGNEIVAYARSNGYFPSFDPPTFNQYGGQVLDGYQPTLSSGEGTIYYTLDGTDPRLEGGGISPSALIWMNGAVTVSGDTTITTRVRTSGNEWSALAEPRYVLASRHEPPAGELQITEINYNPEGEDEYEFIEIWNPGPDFLDLSGASVSNGVRYIFPEGTSLDPGEFVVLVEDAAAFADRYQNVTSTWYWDGIVVAGEWVGGLSNGGETLAVLASDGSVVTEVSYRTDGEWPERANGDGSTLQLMNPDEPGDINDGRSWVSSSLYHGSPGRFEPAGNGVVINEVLSHTDVDVDWIEFWNTSDVEVDLSGYAITDDLDWPDRYILPAGSTIDAGGYMTVSASLLGFGFSELGAEASLLEVSGSQIVRIVERVRFPAAQREEPFGRYVRSDGDTDFTELVDVTPMGSNTAPRVGPVVISEIMFAPELGHPEYIEIVNISSSPVALYDPAIPTNTWGFSGAGDFAFPEGITLVPDQIAILCSTNPVVFRAQYGLGEDILVFGPWLGGLAAEGEKLQLLSPGDPEFDGFVPMYRADHVTYRTNDSWAVANTGGISLERWPLNSYGNDPVNWRASEGTPGTVIAAKYPMGLEIGTQSRSGMAIAFEMILGESYEVLYTESLIDPDWQTLQTIPTATINWIEVVDPEPSSDKRYYRVIWNR